MPRRRRAAGPSLTLRSRISGTVLLHSDPPQSHTNDEKRLEKKQEQHNKWTLNSYTRSIVLNSGSLRDNILKLQLRIAQTKASLRLLVQNLLKLAMNIYPTIGNVFIETGQAVGVGQRSEDKWFETYPSIRTMLSLNFNPWIDFHRIYTNIHIVAW